MNETETQEIARLEQKLRDSNANEQAIKEAISRIKIQAELRVEDEAKHAAVKTKAVQDAIGVQLQADVRSRKVKWPMTPAELAAYYAARA
jgi:ribosomal protein L9